MVSLYVGVAFFIFFALMILIWSCWQYKNQKTIEEHFHSLSDINDPRNGIFYIASQYNNGRGGLPYYNQYENSAYHERQIDHSSADDQPFNPISRSISPPAYESVYEIVLEVPPSYEECSKLGYT